VSPVLYFTCSRSAHDNPTVRLTCPTLFALALLTFAASAGAQQHQRVVVVLRDGGVVEGDLVELTDGDHVTVKTADGVEHRMAWGDILSNTMVPSNATPPPPPPPPPPWYSGSDGVVIKIQPTNYDGPPTFDQAEGGNPDGVWKHVCLAPCDARIDPKGLYRISGGTELSVDKYGNGSDSRMYDSNPFHVAPRSQTLSVDGASTSDHVLGWVFMPTSAAFFVPAVLAFTGAYSDDKSFNDMFRFAFGLPMALGGAAFFGIGLWFVLSHTSVKDDTGQTIARRPPSRGIELRPEGLVF
jgi:hypothetical protein